MRDGFSTFRRAAAGEAEQVFDLIRQRIAWMDERGIQQWNHPGYLRRYPLDYFRQCAEEGQLYALWTECGVLAAGAVVLEEDPRWTGYGGKALYVHNLAASLHFRSGHGAAQALPGPGRGAGAGLSPPGLRPGQPGFA